MKRDGHSAKRKILPLFLCLLLSLTMVPTVALAEDGRSGDIPSGNVSAAGDGAKGGALAGPDAQGGSSDGAEGEDIGGSGDTDKEGSGDSESESGEDSDGSGTTDLPSDKEDEGDPVPGDGSASGQDSSAAAPDDKASPDADAPSALPNEAEPQVPPTDDEASQADALSLAPNDSPDTQSYMGITVRRTNLYTEPSAEAAVADYFWPGILRNGFSRWDVAGEWLTVWYEGVQYYTKASDVSLNDAADGSRYAGITLGRANFYEYPSTAAPVRDFFWGGVVYGGFSAWDASGDWLTFSYEGQRCFIKASYVLLNDATDTAARRGFATSGALLYETPSSSATVLAAIGSGATLSGLVPWDAAGKWFSVSYQGAQGFVPSASVVISDATDVSGYTGVTLRRANLYAAPDASQDPVDFFWGGVVLSGYSRWDAAGEWLAIVYAGQRYYVKAADVSLNDAPGRDVPYVGRTLGRVSMRPSPDLSSEPFDFFWGGVEVPAAPWDAAGEWVLSSYRGQAAFLPADSVELVLADPMVRKAQDYTSTTPYLILVDTAEHKVGVFSGGGNGGWRRIHFWDCANGAPATPTVKGSFTVGIRGYYFDSSNARCFYYTQFYGNYLFHSTLYYQYPTPSHPMDSRLGMALSHGCVRLQLDNAKWIYDNIPWGTKVVVY